MLKIPSSINWLVKKRGRIDGSIQKIEHYLREHQRAFSKYQELTSELLLLKETLGSIDATLRLHKLQIDPENIPTSYSKNQFTDLRRGELTRLIYEGIGAACGEPVCSKDLVDFILEYRKASGEPTIVRTFLSRQLRKRLNTLCRQGKVIRHHSQITTHYGWWTLPADFSLDTQLEDDDLGNSL